MIYLKRILLYIGKRFYGSWVFSIEMTLNYIKLGRWMSVNNFYTDDRLPNRNAVFDSVIHVVQDLPVAYLEFGVKHGESMKYFSSLLKHPSSFLHGFDSF